MKKPTIRWTIEAAGIEFVTDRDTLAGNLRKLEIAPGKDGKFSTAQICAGAFGDLKQERLRLVSAQAGHEELALAQEREQLIPTGMVAPFMFNVFFSIKRIVERSALQPAEKDAIYHELAGMDAKQIVDAILRDLRQQQEAKS